MKACKFLSLFVFFIASNIFVSCTKLDDGSNIIPCKYDTIITYIVIDSIVYSERFCLDRLMIAFHFIPADESVCKEEFADRMQGFRFWDRDPATPWWWGCVAQDYVDSGLLSVGDSILTSLQLIIRGTCSPIIWRVLEDNECVIKTKGEQI